MINDTQHYYKPIRQQTPAWLQGARAADPAGIKRSKPGVPQNPIESIGFAKRAGYTGHWGENLGKPQNSFNDEVATEPLLHLSNDTVLLNTAHKFLFLVAMVA